MTDNWDGPERRSVNGQFKEVAREAVRETLTTLGADVENPIEMQKDFAHMRDHRLAKERLGRTARKAAIGAAVGTVVTGGVVTVWMVLKDSFLK